MNTVQQFRKAGFKVRCTHKRRIHCSDELYSMWELREKEFTHALMSTGGKTIVEVTTPENKEFSAEAICSDKDGFSKKVGVRIALGRIKQQMQESLNLVDTVVKI